MTTTISTNPEAAAQINGQINQANGELAEARTALGATRRGSKAHREVEARVDAINSQIAFLKTQLPATFVDPDLARADLVTAITNIRVRFDDAKASFIARVQGNPIDAMSWSAKDLVKAQARHEMQQDLLGALANVEDKSFAAAVAEMDRWVEYQTTRLLCNMPRSRGDAFDTAIEMVSAEARADFLRTDMAWPKLLAMQLAEQVEATATTRMMYESVRRTVAYMAQAQEA